MGPVALLDANVIWSAALRDTLLIAAERGLFRPAWTLLILNEMSRNLKAKRPDLAGRIDRSVLQIIEFFPDALVQGYEGLVPEMTNHTGDRHVLAAAVRAEASIIVTWNKSHFPLAACAPYGIRPMTPDEFLCQLWLQDAQQMVLVLVEQSTHLISPPRTLNQLLDTLRQSVPAFAEMAANSGLLD